MALSSFITSVGSFFLLALLEKGMYASSEGCAKMDIQTAFAMVNKRYAFKTLESQQLVTAPDGFECLLTCTEESRDDRCVKNVCCITWSTYCMVRQAYDQDHAWRTIKDPQHHFIQRHYNIRARGCESTPHCTCQQPFPILTRPALVRRVRFSNGCPEENCMFDAGQADECCWEYVILEQPGCGVCANSDSLLPTGSTATPDNTNASPGRTISNEQ